MVTVAPIHVIGIVVSLLLFYQSVKLVRSRRENLLEFLLWIFFGSTLFVYTVARMTTRFRAIESINAFLRSLGFGTGERGLLVLSVISLFLIVFYTYTMVKTNDRQMADLQQEIALLRYEIEQLDGGDSTSDSRESESRRRSAETRPSRGRTESGPTRGPKSDSAENTVESGSSRESAESDPGRRSTGPGSATDQSESSNDE